MIRIFRTLRIISGLALLGGACVYSGILRSCNLPAAASNPITALLSSGETQIHYAPAENLETVDLAQIAAVTGHLDIGMYAFTDRAIAAEIIRLASLGVVIRLYRDGDQYEQEERRGYSTTEMFRGHANIHIRVKAASREDLRHLKAYSDGKVLRDGSANWSKSGLRYQDNNLSLTSSSTSVDAFERNFDVIWERPNSLVIQ